MNDVMCNNCHEYFSLDEKQVKKTDLNLDEGLCNVQYFVCPHCKQVYLFYIQTKETEILQVEYMGLGRKIKSATSLGKQPKKKLTKRYLKARKDLESAQKFLLEKYKDKIVVS